MKPTVISRIANAVAVLGALLVLGAVLLWAPPCSGHLELANGNMAPMRCAYTAKIALLLAVIVLVLAVVGLATGRLFALPVCLLAAALVLLTFDTPLSIGVCRSPMACWDTALWLRIGGGVLLATMVAGLVAGKRPKIVA